MQQDITQGFRLSPQQERLWLLQQACSNTYRAECRVIIEGDLAAGILERALEQVIARHEILRTTFHTLTGMDIPVQVIAEGIVSSINLIDASGRNAQEQEAELEALAKKMNEQPFDFEQGPLLRLSLVSLSRNKHALLILMPALCADLAALRNLAHDISYACAVGSGDEGFAGEVMQYADFAEWQNELLEAADADAGKEYWRRQDFSGLDTLKLPFARWRSEDINFEPGLLAVTINPDIAARIEALASSASVPVPAVLLACWQALLFRLTGQSDIVVAACSEGRNYGELESALGLIAKYLPLRCQLEPRNRFSELLKQAAESIREASKWQEYFNWRQLGAFKDGGSASALFPICFDFAEKAESHFGNDVSFSIQKQYVCIDRFKIKLSCAYHGDSLAVEFHYDLDSFSLEDVERLAERYSKALESAVMNCQTPLVELEVIGEIERHQVLVEFNGAEVERREDVCVHHLFEAQVERTPGDIAVVCEGRQLTYEELNARANQLAHHLRQVGVGPEVLVAICVEKSLEMVVGLLGILKAGGAYVPLDPALPMARLAFMLADIDAPVVLTEQRLVAGLPDQVAALICMDAEWDLIAKQSEENLASGATAANLVYVIYTSGSTGKPKGVAIEHRQLVNYVNAILERLDLPAGSGFAMISTLAADLGNTALFPSLLSGGCLHLISQERAMAPDALADYFNCHQVDCLKIVPSHLSALLSASRRQQILPRKRLVLGGETCSPAMIEHIKMLAPDCLIINHYGPTEATVGAITYRMEEARSDHGSTPLPLGRPIANTQIYILDEYLNPSPIGVPAQLHIAGLGLARGYLNLPSLSADRFIPNPFTSLPGARLYKTGDLARYLEDGNIEFLGRIDHQVKVRGYRIELGEIEAALMMHPAVRQSAVVATEQEGGGNRLVGYLVAEEGQAISASEIRRHLKQSLPEYMIPGSVIALEKMPLTANGKVDRKSLPDVDDSRPDLDASYAAPQDSVELQLVKIWEKVLAIQPIGVEDNFFELGGHSLLAVRLFSQIENRFGMNLSPATLFQAPTIKQMASILRQKGCSESWSSLVAIRPGGSKPPLFCVHAA
jgi:amino acid adenylation domain-containing protein